MFSMGFDDLLLLSPALILFSSGLLIFLGIFLKQDRYKKLYTSLVSFSGLVLALFMNSMLKVRETRFVLNEELIFDDLTFWGGNFILLAGFFSLLLFIEQRKKTNRFFVEMVFLIINSIAFLWLLVSSNDLFMSLAFLQLASILCLLVSGVSSAADSIETTDILESILKNFLSHTTSLAFSLLGVVFIYGSLGTVQINLLNKVAGEIIFSNRFFLMGVLFFLVGLFARLGIFPFQYWKPDSQEGVDTWSSLFSEVVLKSSIYLFCTRLFLNLGIGQSASITSVLQWLAVFTIALGHLLFARQKSFRRSISYLSIAQSGVLLMCLVTIAVAAESSSALIAGLICLSAYTLYQFGLHTACFILEKQKQREVYVQDLEGLSSYNLKVSVGLALLFLGLAGLVPTFGFWVKFHALKASLGEGLLWLSVFAGLSLMLGSYQLLQWVLRLFMSSPFEEVKEEKRIPVYAGTLFFLVCILILFLGFKPDLIYGPIAQVAGSYF